MENAAERTQPPVAAPDTAGQEPQPARLLPLRVAVILALTVVVEALAACWVLGTGLSLPLAGAMPIALLPQLLAGVALALALFTAPFLAASSAPSPCPLPQGEGGTTAVARAAFAALWQAGALGFLLLVATRLAPLTDRAIVLACAWLALCALAALLLAQVAPRCYAGIVFIWVIAVPVCLYLTIEVALSTPSGPSPALRALADWLLGISPGTAFPGILTGRLPGGSPFVATVPFAVMAVANVVLAWLAVRREGPKAGMASNPAES
jgi:hypothetical protein